MSRLETLDRNSWRDFVAAPTAVLMLGKTDCQACAAWTAELSSFLESDAEFADVRFGKIFLDQGGLADFSARTPGSPASTCCRTTSSTSAGNGRRSSPAVASSA